MGPFAVVFSWCFYFTKYNYLNFSLSFFKFLSHCTLYYILCPKYYQDSVVVLDTLFTLNPVCCRHAYINKFQNSLRATKYIQSKKSGSLPLYINCGRQNSVFPTCEHAPRSTPQAGIRNGCGHPHPPLGGSGECKHGSSLRRNLEGWGLYYSSSVWKRGQIVKFPPLPRGIR